MQNWWICSCIHPLYRILCAHCFTCLPLFHLSMTLFINSLLFELCVMTVLPILMWYDVSPNLGLQIPGFWSQNSTNVNCSVGGFMPPNSLVMLWRVMWVFSKEYMCSYPGKHGKKWALNQFWKPWKDIYTLHWGPSTFMELSEFFSPCTSAKLWAPIWPPSAPSGFRKINDRNTVRMWTASKGNHASQWLDVHLKQIKQHLENKMSLSYVAWFMTTLQVLHLSPKALIVSPHHPSILRRDVIHQLGRSTDFQWFFGLFTSSQALVAWTCFVPRLLGSSSGPATVGSCWHNENHPPTWWNATKTKTNNKLDVIHHSGKRVKYLTCLLIWYMYF